MVPELQIAMVTAAATVGATTLPVLIANRRAAKRVEAKLGDPNGYGSLVEMVAKTIAEQQVTAARVAAVEVSQRRVSGRLDAIENRLSVADAERHTETQRRSGSGTHRFTG